LDEAKPVTGVSTLTSANQGGRSEGWVSMHPSSKGGKNDRKLCRIC